MWLQQQKVIVKLAVLVAIMGISLLAGCSRGQYPLSETDARQFLEQNFVHLQEMEIVDARTQGSTSLGGVKATTVQFRLPPTQLPQDWMNYLLDAMKSKGKPMKEEETNLYHYPENISELCSYGVLGYFPKANLYAAEYRLCGYYRD